MLINAVFDDIRMRSRENAHPAFDKVVHVVHAEWHGIRKATAYCPGQKLLIPGEEDLEDAEIESIAERLSELGITRIVFQGYSKNADRLALHLRALFDPSVQLYAVTHVTTAQFDHVFEMEMQSLLFTRRRYNTLSGLGSLKPAFHKAFPEYWPQTLLNFAPSVDRSVFMKSPGGLREAYVPLDVGWRKNLYTNALGCALSEKIARVSVTNFPTGLEALADVSKLRLVGFLRGDALLSKMATSDVVVLGTFAECQPTTQLEALAVGTPVLTGPLGLDEFAGDPLCDLTQMTILDNPAEITASLDRLLDVIDSDDAEISQMIDAHLAKRHKLAFERYADFLQL